MPNNPTPRDQNRVPSIIGVDTISGQAEGLSAFSLAGGVVIPLAVAVVDGSGTQVTSFGGGTQYTDGAVPPAHPIGNTIEWSDGSNWQTVSTAKPLPVSASISGTSVVTGNKTNNNAAPGATNIGALVGIANAAAPTYTEGNEVLLSTDLAGNTRVILNAETTKVIGTVRNVGNIGGIFDAVRTAAVPANVLLVGGRDYNGNIQAISMDPSGNIYLAMDTSPVDGRASIAAQTLTNQNLVWNGSTWDLQREVINATNSTGTGITAVGNLAQFDDTSPTAISENQFGNLRMSANRNLYGTIRDAAGNERGANVDAEGNLGVAQKAPTATLSNVSTSNSSATLLASNTARIGATITNEATTVLYVKFGTTASATSYTVVLAGAASAPYSYYEVPAGYTGRIDGILASSTGTARVTEIT